MNSKTGLVNVESRKILPLPGLELKPVAIQNALQDELSFYKNQMNSTWVVRQS
jgi:hypothetical protein